MKWCWEARCSSPVRPICQGTFWVSSRVSCTISKLKTERGISLKMLCGKELHLAMTGEPHGFSRVAAGFSSYDGELRVPHMSTHGSPISIRVARWSWGLVLKHCRANRVNLGLCAETPCFFQWLQGFWGCT